MGVFSPAEVVEQYAAAGKRKASLSVLRMFLLGMLAGALIALAGVGASTASHTVEAVGTARLISGVVFPAGLMMVVLLGAELFTGNCLMVISVLDRQIRISGMLRNWLTAYLGNFAGSVLVAAGCAFGGQFSYSSGALAVTAVKTATAKCSMSFGGAFLMGLFCNMLVCIAVLQAFAAKDAAGKLLGVFFPVCLFVLCGFEHSVANMFYVPAGIFALQTPAYAAAIQAAGLDLSALTWGGFLFHNLLPVTLGNLAGGAGIGALMWYAFRRKKEG